MANVLDYLDWRGDLPFQAVPLNEVDALIFSLLAYTDLGQLLPREDSSLSLGEVWEQLAPTSPARDNQTRLLERAAASRRFGGARLCRYTDVLDRERDLQFAAVTFLLENGAVVAFRGTDGSLAGWKEDFDFSFRPETEGQRMAIAYLDTAGRESSGPLWATGHSKGGHLAVYAASFCAPAVRERLVAVYSHDGPGFRREILDSPGYQAILPRVRHLLPDSSLVGQLLADRSTPVVIKSFAGGINQHDGFTWSVQRDRFEPARLSPLGEMAGKAMGGWLEKMDDAARQTFTDTVFSLFESTGQSTFSGMGDQKLKSAAAMAQAARLLPKENQQEVLRMLSQLGVSSGQAALSTLLNWNEPK